MIFFGLAAGHFTELTKCFTRLLKRNSRDQGNSWNALWSISLKINLSC